MDMQQMQLVMDMILKMGELGGNAFYAWLILDKVIPMLTGLLICWGFYLIAVKLIGFIPRNDFLIELRTLLKIGSSGHITTSESMEIVREVKNLMARTEAQQKTITELNKENASLRDYVVNDKKNRE